MEEKIEMLLPAEKLKIQQKKAKPILKDMKAWVDEKRPKITPKSVEGKAINYFYNECEYLICYLEDGKINFSNCGLVNKIRPICHRPQKFSARVLMVHRPVPCSTA